MQVSYHSVLKKNSKITKLKKLLKKKLFVFFFVLPADMVGTADI